MNFSSERCSFAKILPYQKAELRDLKKPRVSASTEFLLWLDTMLDTMSIRKNNSRQRGSVLCLHYAPSSLNCDIFSCINNTIDLQDKKLPAIHTIERS
mmetsp:Transcript_11191/g.34274  ORF Transcript_11191/g.34274 Transcript_11191/m.34274 type:complete len:98 (+) Transcript_11191:1000-1293(+)